MTKNQLEEKEDRHENVPYGTHTGDQIGGQKWKEEERIRKKWKKRTRNKEKEKEDKKGIGNK